MEVVAKLRYLRMAPRKVRLVADSVRGKSVEEAQNSLTFLNKKAAEPLLKLLNSAMANAKNNFHLDPLNLYISKITVDEGPKYKRWMSRARGRVSEIQKKTSHIILTLEEIKKGPKKAKKPRKAKRIKEKEAEKVKEAKKEKVPKIKKFRMRPEKELSKPEAKRGIRRIFRRKAF